MVAKLTPKEEAIALKYVECHNQSEAYRHAYDVGENTKPETVWQSACRTLAKPHVAARVYELQQAAAERTLVTVQSITSELNESRALAIDQDNAGEMTKATMAKAKIHGLDVHKVDINANITGLDSLFADVAANGKRLGDDSDS